MWHSSVLSLVASSSPVQHVARVAALRVDAVRAPVLEQTHRVALGRGDRAQQLPVRVVQLPRLRHLQSSAHDDLGSRVRVPRR